MNAVDGKFKVETNNGLIDVSGCSIKIEGHGPIMGYDPPEIFYNLIANDFRTEKKEVIAQFEHKENAEAAYEKIKEACKKNESYVNIKDCESDDQNQE